MDQASDDDSQTIRCTCGNTLWRAFEDAIQIRVRLRRGEHLEVCVAGMALSSVNVKCARCGVRWWPVSPTRPMLAGASGGVLQPVTP